MVTLGDLPYDLLRKAFVEWDYDTSKSICRVARMVPEMNSLKEMCNDLFVWAEKAQVKVGTSVEEFMHRSWLESYIPLPEGDDGRFLGQNRYAEIVSKFNIVSDSDQFLSDEEMLRRVVLYQPDNVELISKFEAKVRDTWSFDRILEAAGRSNNVVLFAHYINKPHIMGSEAFNAGYGGDPALLPFVKSSLDKYYQGILAGGHLKTLDAFVALIRRFPRSWKSLVVGVVQSGNAELLQEVFDLLLPRVREVDLLSVIHVNDAAESQSIDMIQKVIELRRIVPRFEVNDYRQIWHGAFKSQPLNIAFLDQLITEFALNPDLVFSALRSDNAWPILEWMADHLGRERLERALVENYEEAIRQTDESFLYNLGKSPSLAARAWAKSFEPPDYEERFGAQIQRDLEEQRLEEELWAQEEEEEEE